MTIKKDTGIRFLYTVILSIAIYMVSLLWLSDDGFSFIRLAISIVVGLIIWALAETLLALTQRLWPYSNIPSYMVLIVIIGIGTLLGGYVLGIRFLTHLIIICFLAEVFGILIVHIYLKHYKKILNEKLESFKKS